MNILEVLRILFGTVFILFIPGFAWSYVFFARKNIDWIERVALSLGLSITLVPISIFWLNWLFHMKITLASTSITVIGLVVLAAALMFFKRRVWNNVARKLREPSNLHGGEQDIDLIQK